jgi:hypothetical protein
LQIPDSVLSHHLQHVLWICGGACGGKTTMASMLADKYGMLHYNCDEHAVEYKKIASPEDHPATLRHFVDWEWYFGRPGAEIARWLTDVLAEQFSMAVLDLVKLGADAGRRVVCEGCLPPGAVKRVGGFHKAIFLYPERELLLDQYFARDDKQDMLRLIDQLSDPAQMKRNVLDCAAVLLDDDLARAESLGLRTLIRGRDTTPEMMLREIEEHFGLGRHTGQSEAGDPSDV